MRAVLERYRYVLHGIFLKGTVPMALERKIAHPHQCPIQPPSKILGDVDNKINISIR